ncbi:MAG: hypothetical protein HOO86_08650 [Bacteroidales bacterium]|nr:hypothetical protein [Bacteroidales bacterium]
MKQSKSYDLKPILIVAGLLLLIFVFYIASRMQSTDRRLIPLSVLALLAGVFFEAKRLFEKWSTLFWVALGSFVFSFFAFLPGKHERVYIFEDHIQMWPYVFLFFFVVFAISFNKDKTIARLTEGITLMQSIAVVYWVIDLHLYETNSSFVKVLMVIGLLFSVFSLFNAFTPFILSRTNRLTLSIWSCVIMVLFAVDNIYRTYQTEDIEVISSIPYGLLIGLQFFFLGICSIYIAQNFFMLIMFLPGKGTFFNAQYFKDLRELKDDHIKRYSDKQVNFLHSLFCLVMIGGVFYLNYKYQVLPRNIAIWTVFVVFPSILYFFDIATQQNRH